MGSPLMDGAMQGFNMMERHQARLDNRDRLSRLDDRNETRYQDALDRNGNRYQDTVEYRNDTQQKTADYRKQTSDATIKHRTWQQNASDKKNQWVKDQSLMGAGWQYFRENGRVAPEHEEMFKRNAGQDPRTFQRPEMRQAIKGLGEKLEQSISSGQLAQVNNPETIKLFDTVFKDQFSSSIGNFDYVVGAKITDVSFAGFVPTGAKSGAVSFALKVNYDNGKSQIKPMTQGRSTENDDPVLQRSPQEIIHMIQTKMMMADMIERPDYWDKMGESVGNNFKKRQQTDPKIKIKAAYRKELSLLERDKAKAIVKIESSNDFIDVDERKAAIDRVISAFDKRKLGIDQSFGVTSAKVDDGSGQDDLSTLSNEQILSKLNGVASIN